MRVKVTPQERPADDIFHAELREEGDATCVCLYGELDIATAHDAARALWTAENGDKRVVVDLSGLHFIDLNGLRLIIGAHERLRRRLVLLRGPRPVHRLFELTRTTDRLPFAD